MRSAKRYVVYDADPRVHPWEEIETFDAFMNWIKEHEPRTGVAAGA